MLTHKVFCRTFNNFLFTVEKSHNTNLLVLNPFISQKYYWTYKQF
nr:MAG TPA: hypothetical protein [Caudoviricetes sp.]